MEDSWGGGLMGERQDLDPITEEEDRSYPKGCNVIKEISFPN